MVPRLTPIDCELLVRFFESHGYVRARQKGSHLSLSRVGAMRPLVIPMGDLVSVGVIMSNLRSAGLTRDQLMVWLVRN